MRTGPICLFEARMTSSHGLPITTTRTDTKRDGTNTLPWRCAGHSVPASTSPATNNSTMTPPHGQHCIATTTTTIIIQPSQPHHNSTTIIVIHYHHHRHSYTTINTSPSLQLSPAHHHYHIIFTIATKYRI